MATLGLGRPRAGPDPNQFLTFKYEESVEDRSWGTKEWRWARVGGSQGIVQTCYVFSVTFFPAFLLLKIVLILCYF